jgi:hypothetical protein
MNWPSPEADLAIVEGRRAGISYEEIGRQLGVTKNMVLSRSKRIEGIEKAPRPYRLKAAPALAPVTAIGGCRFIEGDPREARRGVDIWCDDPTTGPGEPYCGKHQTRCYQKVPPATGAPFKFLGATST